jgi:hypothetical protein
MVGTAPAFSDGEQMSGGGTHARTSPTGWSLPRTRSLKALNSAAIVAALALPAVASAQDTSRTGSRVTRDSAGVRNAAGLNRMRLDTAQTIALTGVTIARNDSTGPGASHGADKTSPAATGAHAAREEGFGKRHAAAPEAVLAAAVGRDGTCGASAR